jgi:hypothetical protein
MWKRGTLSKDSCLKYIVNCLKIDLSRLIRGLHFTISYTLSKNRYSIVVLSLIHTRANSFAFIDIAFIN